jgi:AcrR family transcriptional regulator
MTRESKMGIRERRQREEQSRLAAILTAAEKVFAAKGYHTARMDDVAEAAELAKGTLYYYFESKDAIFLHLLASESQKAHERVLRLISTSSSFFEVLEKALYFYLDYFDENRGFLKLFLPYLCGLIRVENPGAVRKSAGSYEQHGAVIRKALGIMIKREHLPFKIEELQKFFQTMQIGIGLKLLQGRKDEARAAVKFFLDLIRHVMEESS